MPVDRALFLQNLTAKRAPNWRCPRCGGGHLRLVADSLHHEFSGDTKAASHEAGFDADWVVTQFVALVRCDNEDCKEVAAVAGSGRVIEAPNWEAQEMDYEDLFSPTHVYPSPPIIRLPDKCPAAVTEELKLATICQWNDATAAAGHIRTAVERLLDAVRVAKTTLSKKGRTRLTLHQRIALFEKQKPEQAQALLATKWLGNAGVHAGEIRREDVFDMFDIIENVLEDLYGSHAKGLAKLVAAVNKARGPTTK